MSTDQTEVVPRWTTGERLRKARIVAGLTPEEMATDIGRSDRTIRNYESDTTQAPLLVVRQYAMRCGVPLAWLMDQGDSEPTSTDSARYPYTCHPRWVA
ncbi:hypothetical protein BH24ACT15_BH24ACT15_31820 [soil metagenome]